MHVLILNQTFYPDVAATAQLMWDLAQHLERRGHRVTALTSRNFYGTDRPAGPAYQRLGAIEIYRVGGTAFGKRHLLGRLADFASFYVAAGWQLQQLPAADVVLALTSPPMIAALAMLQKQFRSGGAGRNGSGHRSRFVYHVMDLYPDAAVASAVLPHGSALHGVLRQLTARTLHSADAIIALGRDMKERLDRQYGRGTLSPRIHVIPPWADGQALYPMDKQASSLAGQLHLRETFNIVYSGNLGIAHDLDTIVAAIQATAGEKDLRWVFAGGGQRFKELGRLAALAGWPHVRLLPYQDRAALNDSLNLADVHLVSQLPAFTGVVVPSKLFGIMAVGRPTVMVGPADAECGRILQEHGAGVVVGNGDARGLVASLRQLQQDQTLRRQMGQQARLAFEQHYDRPIACGKIEAVLRGVCGEDGDEIEGMMR